MPNVIKANKRPLRSRELISRISWPIIGILLILAVWQLLVLWTNLPRDTLPEPAAVAQSFVDNWGAIAANSFVTLKEILIGFVLAVVLGIPVAIGIAFNPILDRLLYPLIVMSQAVPKIIVAPLFLLWFGFGITTNVLVAMLIAIFPVIVNTVLGFEAIDQDLIRLARVMGGNGKRIFWKIRIPAAMPSIFAGLKLAITFATLGAVAGELVAGQAGLGYLVNFASGNLNAGLSFAAIVALSVIGVVLFYFIVAAEFFAVRGRPAKARGNR
jgi:NitT/TauT family transport system permease protein